jgi:hypothetical protein
METRAIDVRVPELKIKYPKKRPAPPGMPALYSLGMICGSRGSGKTTALVRMVKAYDEARSYDHLFLWAPCFHSDPKYQELARKTNYELHLYDRDFAMGDFKEALSAIEANNEDYEEWEEHRQLWKKFLRVKDPMKLRDSEVLKLDKAGWQPPDAGKFPLGRPTNLIVFDDCVGSRELYRADSKGPVASFVIKHRHHHTSIIFMSQIFSNAVPKQIRSNLSFVVLFAQKNEGIRKSASLEFSSHVSAERFAQMWEQATAENHSFFFADFEAPPDVRFRIGFDRAFVVGGQRPPRAGN